MDSSSRRHALSDLLGDDDDDDDDNDLEEGEYVPGHYHSSSDSDTDNDDHFDRHQSSGRVDDNELHPQHGGGRMRRLDDIIAAGGRVGAGKPLPASPTTPASSESDGTISDDHRSGDSSGGGGARPARKFVCHVCSKGFSSRKAVDGHMRVHGSGGGSGGAPHVAPFSGGWAATGRRGSTGGKSKPSAVAGSLNSQSTTGHSTAIVVAQVPPLEPVPMAFAVTTNLSPMPSSTRTNLSASGEGDEGSSASASASATAQPMHYAEPVAAAAAVVTGANPSSTGAGARDAGLVVDDQLAVADQQAPAPQVHRQAVSSVPPPAAQQAHFAQQPLVPPPAAAAGVQLQQGGQLVVPRPAQPPREYSCKECGKTYSTHQGLGGHAAGHKNRQREQEAMAAAAGMMMMPNGEGGGGEYLAALRRGGRKAEEPHKCQKCNKVFATGVALGGHMRMHYTGPPIVHKSKKRCVTLGAPPAISEADLRLALSTVKTSEDQPSSSTAPAAVAGTGRLRLFGIDIGPLVQQLQAPSEQQGSGSGTTTEEGSSSAGEQQHK